MDREQEEEILRITAQYVAEVQAGKEPNLSGYLECYPQYADALIGFVLYYHTIEVHLPSETPPAPLSEISAIALEKAYERTFGGSSPASSPRKLMSLLRSRKPALHPSALAAPLDVSVDIVMLLEQRRLTASSLPDELYQRMAQALQLSVEDIRTYLSTPQQADHLRQQGPQRAKVADAKRPYVAPADDSSAVPPQQSFRRAVEESKQLSEQQRKSWLAILEREGL